MTDLDVRVITDSWLAAHLPDRPERAHKGDFGRVLVVAGSLEYPGAAVLSAIGALRAGAGVVRVATADAVAARLAGAAPEVTWLSLDEEAPGLIAPGGWRRVTAEAGIHDAALVGPGLGQQPATQRRARQLVASLPVPAVVDADGLNALAASGPRWWQGLRSTLILTPHPGEFARLADASAPPPDDDDARAAAAAEAAARWGQIVVLKGARTIVAAPDGALLGSPVATPALATAGSGDVLAGVIAALLAGGLSPLDAAGTGVGLHASAGLLAAQRLGRGGVLATDVARLLPEVAERLRSSARR